MTRLSFLAVLSRVGGWVRPQLPDSRGGRALFGILLGVGIVLRLAGLDWGVPPRENAASFYHDEAHVLADVEMPWEQFKTTFGEYEIVRPVFLWRILGRPLFALGTALQWNAPQTRVYEFAVLRFSTALFGIAGLIGVYLLGKRVGGTAVGLWALAFLVVMPGHWYYSQILKGDLLVATFFTFLLLAAFRIAERGDWVPYFAAGALLGTGTALKPTVLIAAPVLLAAHLARSWRERRWSALWGIGPVGGVAVAVMSFLLLYPYPFLDFSRLRFLFENPSMQSFVLRMDFSPETYQRVWQQYNKPPRVFMEMVYGRALQLTFLPALLLVAFFGFWRWRGEHLWRLILTLLLFGLFYHSLTFTDPLDDRYILPLAPLVVLFPALVVGVTVPNVSGRFFQLARVAVGVLIFSATTAVTALAYPSFGIVDHWEEAVAWVQERAHPKALVGQPVLISRWSLVFDRSKIEPTALITGGDDDRHVTRLANPAFIVVQREPWNYDHTFRYELEGVRESFQALLARYEPVRTFGREPSLFGRRLPRNRGMPVIDVYRRLRAPEKNIVADLLPSGPATLRNAPQSAVMFPQTFTTAELERASVSVTLDLRAVPDAWFEDGKRVRVGLVALWDGGALPQRFPNLPESETFVTNDRVWAWLQVLRPEDLRGRTTLSLAFDHPQGELWDVYDGFDENLRAHTSGTRRFATARFGVVLLGSAVPDGVLRVSEASIARLDAP